MNVPNVQSINYMYDIDFLSTFGHAFFFINTNNYEKMAMEYRSHTTQRTFWWKIKCKLIWVLQIHRIIQLKKKLVWHDSAALTLPTSHNCGIIYWNVSHLLMWYLAHDFVVSLSMPWIRSKFVNSYAFVLLWSFIPLCTCTFTLFEPEFKLCLYSSLNFQLNSETQNRKVSKTIFVFCSEQHNLNEYEQQSQPSTEVSAQLMLNESIDLYICFKLMNENISVDNFWIHTLRN